MILELLPLCAARASVRREILAGAIPKHGSQRAQHRATTPGQGAVASRGGCPVTLIDGSYPSCSSELAFAGGRIAMQDGWPRPGHLLEPVQKLSVVCPSAREPGQLGRRHRAGKFLAGSGDGWAGGTGRLSDPEATWAGSTPICAASRLSSYDGFDIRDCTARWPTCIPQRIPNRLGHAHSDSGPSRRAVRLRESG